MQKTRHPGKVLALVLGTGLLAAFLSASHYGWKLEQRFGLHWLFTLRGEIEPPEEIIIVDMDQQSALKLGQPTSGRHWRSKWNRSLHACLVDVLSDAGAVVIAFDVLFTEERTRQSSEDLMDEVYRHLSKEFKSCTAGGSTGDSLFTNAIKRSGRVILAEELVMEKLPATLGSATHERRIPPLEIYASKALGTAPFPLPDVSPRLDYFWSFREFGGYELPSLPALAMAAYARTGLMRGTAAQPHIGELEHFATGLTESGFLGQSIHLENALLKIRKMLRQPHASTLLFSQSGFEREARKKDNTTGVALRAVLRMAAGGGRNYLWFYGPAGTIKTIPYYKVVGEANNELTRKFAGKVVFVGATDIDRADQIDSFKTVFSTADGIDISGVEIAATAFMNLLNASSVVPLAPHISIAIVYGFAVVTVILFMTVTLRYVYAALPLIALLYLLVAYQAFAMHQLWLPLFFPYVVAVPLGALIGLVHRYRREHSRSEGLTRTIQYYVPQDAVRELHENGKPHQRSKLVYGVCMCSDVADYTKLTETVTPEQLVQLDNEYFEALGLVIEQRGGHRLDLTGDGSMSLWQASEPASDLRLQACLASLEIIRASDEFNMRHQSQAFQTRIGLHAGWVAMANIGGGGHYAYKAVGDVPPTASRIESLNKELGTCLLASQQVVNNLENLLLRPVGQFILKGKEKAVRVYEIRGQNSEATPKELALISQFQKALDLFESSRWGEAEEAFKTVLKDFPEDGPSRFFIDHSIYNQRAKSADIIGPTIRLTHK